MDANEKGLEKCSEKCDETEEAKEEPADFEKAMEASGFGLFNLILLMTAIPATFASVFETSTMSYILPIAECDLKLSLLNKGSLNAATYAGMITSAIIWGYISDTQGRKKVLVFGYMADSLCVFISSLSQNFEMLMICKFFGGFVVNGPGAVLFTYVTELHGAKHRARVLMVIGMVTTTATLMLPLLALATFPQDWDFVLFGFLNVHSWQIFLLISGMPSLICSFLFIILPESPKFLMSQGRNEEALRVFQKMYALNTRKPKTSFPITQLMEEVTNRKSTKNEAIYTIEGNNQNTQKKKHRSAYEAFKSGMQQVKPMFRKPLLGHSLHAYTMQFCILLGLNTIRLWLPQLFASIAEYESLEHEDPGNICTILEYSVNKTAQTATDYETRCEMRDEVSLDMYINNIIVAGSGIIGYFLAGVVVKAVGTERLLTYGLLITGCCGIGLYFSSSSLTTLIIAALFVTIGSISTSSLLGVVISLFPTSLRSLVVAIAMMFGRLGALSGNMLFPIFIETGCIPPFLMVGFAMIFASALSCILPNTKKSPLS